MSSFNMVGGARNVVKWQQWKIANLVAILKLYLLKFLLWECRSNAFPPHYTTDFKYKVQEKVKLNLLDIINIFDSFLKSTKEVLIMMLLAR